MDPKQMKRIKIQYLQIEVYISHLYPTWNLLQDKFFLEYVHSIQYLGTYGLIRGDLEDIWGASPVVLNYDTVWLSGTDKK